MERLPEIDFLRQVPLFQDVEESVLRELWFTFRERRLRKGDVLFRTGDPGEELFLIKEGSIVVSKPVTGRIEQVLARLEPGEAFGEMSVFGDERHRSATCQADVDAAALQPRSRQPGPLHRRQPADRRQVLPAHGAGGLPAAPRLLRPGRRGHPLGARGHGPGHRAQVVPQSP